MEWKLEWRPPRQRRLLMERYSESEDAKKEAAALGSPPLAGMAAEALDDDPDAWSTDYRSRAQHDRDRVLYSSAFQRLAYVTQVTAPESGITFHNRLSHSLKVAQIGRRNAERLLAIAKTSELTGRARALVTTLVPDAVEAACLAHDLGHPPFGHIAEEVLQSCAAEHQLLDRFEGNAQSFRIVTRLAQRAGGMGLDLTRQTLSGLLKYPWRHWVANDPQGKRNLKWGYYDDDAPVFRWVRHHPPAEREDVLPRIAIEAAIMEWADDVTYAVHDVDDFFRAGLIPMDRLGEPDSDAMKVFEDLVRETNEESPLSLGASPDDLIGKAKELLPGHVPSEAYRHTRENRRELKRFASERITKYLSAFRVENRPGGEVVCVVDDDVALEVKVLHALVRVFVIRRPGLAVVQHGQKRVIADLFNYYYEASKKEGGDRRLFPPAYRRLLDAEPDTQEARIRLVIDLIAGLTESSAIQLHQRLVGGSVAPTLDATAHMT